MRLLYLDPRQIEPDPQGVRLNMGDIESLAATIAEQGLLQPLGVIERSIGRYQVVFGGRRREAALRLGLERVPCLVLEADDLDLLVQQVTENVARLDLNDMEKALAFARLRERLSTAGQNGDLDDAVGRLVGLAGRTVRRYLGLLDLPEEVQAIIREGSLTVTQAQHLRRISGARRQLELARYAADEGLSAAQVSELASYLAANPTLSVESALDALQSGLELRSAPAVEAPVISAASLPKGAALDLPETEEDFWEDEQDEEEGGILTEIEAEEQSPRNKARVFRIRSLDQMVDESDRLARALHEGDLVKWVAKDEGAPFKLRLLLKQLETLTRALRQLMSEQGWDIGD
ncbi:MAG: chromosome partitioning protein ParB [Herpetosiphonaceae bacterium]|nr:MAG: chromosome partitioning protein ParB [Herpetosiphonaceae bacterium]